MKLWNRRQPEPSTPALVDVSAQTFGKYQHCTSYEGVFYADEDFDRGYGMGKPKLGAIPSPSEKDRTPFGQKRLPAETPEAQAARQERECVEATAAIERQAEAMVPEIQNLQPRWLDALTDYHEMDVASYKFECRRHGDFLSLEITRGANSDEPHPMAHWGARGAPKDFATTINLGSCREIRLTLGHAPDLGGVIEFGFSRRGPGGGRWSGTGDGNYAAGDGWKWVVEKPSLYLPHSKPVFALDLPKKDRSNYVDMGGHRYRVKARIEGSARAAEDDEIRFEGLGATLYIPSGLGVTVHKKILAALATKDAP